MTALPLNDLEFEALLKPFSLNGSVVVAVSGGADSMALLVLMRAFAIQNNITLYALTVDHQLRERSRAEAEAVHSFCAANQVHHEILTWQHNQMPTTRLQESARTARYDLLWNWCRQHNVPTLMTAHHLDDQIETFLMRLNHRSGLKGLCAMKAATKAPHGYLIRPFLSVPKARLVTTLNEHGISWLEDPSNCSVKFERVRLRSTLHQLTDKGLINTIAIGESIQKLQEIDGYFDEQVGLFCKNSESPDTFSRSAFIAEHPVMQRRILQHYLKTLGTQNYMSPDNAIEHVRALIIDPDFKAATLGGLCFIRKRGNYVFVHLEIRKT